MYEYNIDPKNLTDDEFCRYFENIVWIKGNYLKKFK